MPGIVAFREKLELLCRLAGGLSQEKVISDLYRKKGLRPTRTRTWFETDSPVIRSPYRDRFVEYWQVERKINFTHACFSMSLADFNRHFDRPDETANNHGPIGIEGITRFAGVYQILRPHTFLADRFILEAYELGVRNNKIFNRMYSHSNGPQPKYLYEGEGHAGGRYYSSLLIRPHEVLEGQGAFRCLTLFTGSTALDDCLSGLMLRGVSGNRGGRQAVALPLIALRIPNGASLSEPDFVSFGRPGPHRVHRDGYLMLGDIGSRPRYKALYDWCNSIMQSMRSLKDGVISGNDIVLHTVTPSDLSEIEGLDFKSWKAAVDAFWTAPDVGPGQSDGT